MKKTIKKIINTFESSPVATEKEIKTDNKK